MIFLKPEILKVFGIFLTLSRIPRRLKLLSCNVEFFGEQYEIKKSCLRVNAYANTGKPVFFRKMLITRHQVALELSEMYQETQNSILHRTAITTFFRKI